MSDAADQSLKRQNRLVIILSVVLISVVAFLYLGPNIKLVGFNKGTLPFINAWLNGITTVLLIAGLVAITNGKRVLHERIMLSALGLSVLFLVLYVLQHSSFESTVYPDNVPGKTTYLIILITHIILAAAIVPLVLITVLRAFAERFDKHRRIAKITFPLWLYVSISGVVVYLMISPFY